MVEVAIDPNQAAIDTFYELKMDKKHRYCIFTIQIEGKEEIILHKAAPRESTFADLKADLDNHPRYIHIYIYIYNIYIYISYNVLNSL